MSGANSLTITPAYTNTTASTQSYFIRNNTAGMTPYSTAGTVTFTPGSTAVTGTGTGWNSGMVGSWIYAATNPAVVYKVVAVNSATSLIISPAYK